MQIYVHVKLDIPLKTDLKVLKYEANKLQGNFLTCITTTKSDLTSPVKDLIHAGLGTCPGFLCVPQRLSVCLQESYAEARTYIGSSTT